MNSLIQVNYILVDEHPSQTAFQNSSLQNLGKLKKTSVLKSPGK